MAFITLHDLIGSYVFPNIPRQHQAFFVPLLHVPFGIQCKFTEYSDMTKGKVDKNAEISARIARVLEILGQNPNSFAKQLGYGRAQTIYDIIEGKSAPSYDFFNRFVLSEYSVSFNLRWLLCGEGDPLLPKSEKSSPPLTAGDSLLETLCLFNKQHLKEKDEQILAQAKEIGQLSERIRQLETEMKKRSGRSSVLEDFLEDPTFRQSGVVKAG